MTLRSLAGRRKRVSGNRALAAATCFVALSAIPAQAQTQALDFTGGVAALGATNTYTLGWQFTLSTTVTVTQLGLFDEGNNGFTFSHQIGLWTNAGTLLTSTIIGSGLDGTPVVSSSGFGTFRYVNTANVVLTPGTYVLGASYINDAADFLRVMTSSVSTAPGFTFDVDRFEVGSGFTFPSLSVGNNSGNVNEFFGPNLRFTTVNAAPEPGSLGLIAIVAFPIVSLLRRRSR